MSDYSPKQRLSEDSEDYQLISYEKAFGDVDIQNFSEQTSNKKLSSILEETMRLKEALQSNYLKQKHSLPEQEQQEPIYLSERKTDYNINNTPKNKRLNQQQRLPKKISTISPDNQNLGNTSTLANQYEQQNSEHMNPANLKIYKYKHNHKKSLFLSRRIDNQSNFMNNFEGRISLDANQKEKWRSGIDNTRTPFLNKNSRMRFRKKQRGEQHLIYQSPIKKTLQKQIICPRCNTKVTKLILNSNNPATPSPKILKSRSPNRFSFIESSPIKPDQYNIILTRKLQNKFHSDLHLLEQQIRSQFQEYRKDLMAITEQILIKVRIQEKQTMDRQEKLFALEIYNIQNRELIDKMKAQIRELIKGSEGQGQQNIMKNAKQVLNKKEEVKRPRSTEDISNEDNEDKYQGRMDIFNQRTHYAQKKILYKAKQKSIGNRESELRQNSNTKQLGSVVAEELDTLEKMLQAHIICNY